MLVLDSRDYNRIIDLLLSVPVNNLFARAVVEHHVDGIVMVDNQESPKTILVKHPYGMSLLFGETTNKQFNEELRNYALNASGNRRSLEWLQTSPEWDDVIVKLFAGKIIKAAENVNNREIDVIELHTRVNFKFNLMKYQHYKNQHINTTIDIVRTDSNIFHEMKGTVVPSFFWKDADQFIKKSVGYTALKDGMIGATAYAAFIIDNHLEIGIETVEEFRGNKLAQNACSALIDYSIENNYEPVWACRLENTGSYVLAQKLGFEPTIYRPYFKLAKSATI